MENKENLEQILRKRKSDTEDSTVRDEKRQKFSADSQHPLTHQNTNPSKRKRNFSNDAGKRHKASDYTLINFYHALKAETNKMAQAEKIINFANQFNKIPFAEQVSTIKTLASIIILFKDLLSPIFQSSDNFSGNENLIVKQYLEVNKEILQALITNILKKIYEFRDQHQKNKKGSGYSKTLNDYSKTLQAFDLLNRFDLCTTVDNKEILEYLFTEISENFESDYPQHFLIPLSILCRLLDPDIKCIDNSVVTRFIKNLLDIKEFSWMDAFDAKANRFCELIHVLGKFAKWKFLNKNQIEQVTILIEKLLENPQIYLDEIFANPTNIKLSSFVKKLNNITDIQKINLQRIISGLGELASQEFLLKENTKRTVTNFVCIIFQNGKQLKSIYSSNNLQHALQDLSEVTNALANLVTGNCLINIPQNLVGNVINVLTFNKEKFEKILLYTDAPNFVRNLSRFAKSLVFLDKLGHLANIKIIVSTFLSVILQNIQIIQHALTNDISSFHGHHNILITSLRDLIISGYLPENSTTEVTQLIKPTLDLEYFEKTLSAPVEHQAKYIRDHLANLAELCKLGYLQNTSQGQIDNSIAKLLYHTDFIEFFKHGKLFDQAKNISYLLRAMTDLIQLGYLKNMPTKFINDLISNLINPKIITAIIENNYQVLIIKIITSLADLKIKDYLQDTSKKSVIDCMQVIVSNPKKIKQLFQTSNSQAQNIALMINSLNKLVAKGYLKSIKNDVKNFILEFIQFPEEIKKIFQDSSKNLLQDMTLFYVALIRLMLIGYLNKIPKDLICIMELTQDESFIKSLGEDSKHSTQHIVLMFDTLDTFARLGYLENTPKEILANVIAGLASQKNINKILYEFSEYQAFYFAKIIRALADLSELDYLQNILKAPIWYFISKIMANPQRLTEVLDHDRSNFKSYRLYMLIKYILKLYELGLLQNISIKDCEQPFSFLLEHHIQRLTNNKFIFRYHFSDIRYLFLLLQDLFQNFPDEFASTYYMNVVSLAFNFLQEWQKNPTTVHPYSAFIFIQGLYLCLRKNINKLSISEETQKNIFLWLSHSIKSTYNLKEKTKYLLDILSIFYQLTKIVTFSSESIENFWQYSLGFISNLHYLNTPQILHLFELTCIPDFAALNEVVVCRTNVFKKIFEKQLLFREDLQRILAALNTLSLESRASLLNVAVIEKLQQKAHLISAPDLARQFAALIKLSPESSVLISDTPIFEQINSQSLPETSEPTMLSLIETEDTLYLNPRRDEVEIYDIHNPKDIMKLEKLLNISYQQYFDSDDKSKPLAQFYIAPNAIVNGYALYIKTCGSTDIPMWVALSEIDFGVYFGTRLGSHDKTGPFTFQNIHNVCYEAEKNRNHWAFANHGMPNFGFFTNEKGYIEFTPEIAVLEADNQYCRQRKAKFIQVRINYGNNFFDPLNITPLHLDATDNWKTPNDIYLEFHEDFKKSLMELDVDTQVALGFPRANAEYRRFLATDLFAAVFDMDLAKATKILAEAPHQVDLQIFAAEPTEKNQYVSSYQIHQEHITPLMLACYLGYEPLIYLLIAKGVNVNRRGLYTGNTALFFLLNGLASKEDKLRIAKALIIEHGAYVNLINSKEYSILHYCILNNDIDLVNFLVTGIKEGEWFNFVHDKNDLINDKDPVEDDDEIDSDDEQNNNSINSQEINILALSITHGRVEILNSLLETICRNPQNRKILREKITGKILREEIVERSLNLDEALYAAPKESLRNILESLWINLKLHLDPLKNNPKITPDQTIIGRFNQILEMRKNQEDMADICQWFAELTAPAKPKTSSKNPPAKTPSFFGNQTKISKEDYETHSNPPSP